MSPPTSRSARTPACSSTGLIADGDADHHCSLRPRLAQHIQNLRQVDRCEAATVRILFPPSIPMFFLSRLVRGSSAPTNWIFELTSRPPLIGQRKPSKFPVRAAFSLRLTIRAWAGQSPPRSVPVQVRPDRQVAASVTSGDGCFLMSAIETSPPPPRAPACPSSFSCSTTVPITTCRCSRNPCIGAPPRPSSPASITYLSFGSRAWVWRSIRSPTMPTPRAAFTRARNPRPCPQGSRCGQLRRTRAPVAQRPSRPVRA